MKLSRTLLKRTPTDSIIETERQLTHFSSVKVLKTAYKCLDPSDIAYIKPKFICSQESFSVPELSELFLKAKVLSEQGKHDLAGKLYRKMIKIDNNCNAAKINLAATLLCQKVYKSALDLLESICFRKEEFVVGVFNKAICLINLDQICAAYESIGALLELVPEFLQAELQDLKDYCIKASSLRVPVISTKKRSVISNHRFPYIQNHYSPKTERLTKSRCTNVKISVTERNPIYRTVPALPSVPKPLRSVSTAFANFVNQKPTSETLSKHLLTNKLALSGNSEATLQASDIFAQLQDETAKPLLSNQLTNQAIQQIVYEYAKPPSSRNYVVLLTNLSKLSFFSKFSDRIIIEIAKKSALIKYQQGDAIISQGDKGDNMYIILEGTVSVMKRSEEFGNLEVQVNSLYQGETFGEMALLAQVNDESNIKRSATCVSDQSSTIISIAKSDYKHILLDMMKNDIHGKATFFSSLCFFTGIDHYSLIPLAANIEPVTYKINEVILEAGDIPQGLYILYTGRCSIHWEGYLLRKKLGKRNVISKAPKAFHTDAHLDNLPRPSKIFTSAIDLNDSQQLLQASKYLKTDKLADLLKHYDLYKSSIELHKIKAGDYFGCRAITNQGVKTPAKFSIIANTLDVKVFILKFKHFSLLPESVIDTFKRILERSYEPDCPANVTEAELQKGMGQWENYKISLTGK